MYWEERNGVTYLFDPLNGGRVAGVVQPLDGIAFQPIAVPIATATAGGKKLKPELKRHLAMAAVELYLRVAK